MGYTEGVVYSVAGAVAHSAIDVLRKLGSQKMAPVDLVALMTVYDAVIATVGVLVLEGSLPDISSFSSNSQFFAVVLLTSAFAVMAKLLYQRALSIAPLSLTVPYLAFTPAFVVMVSPIFLVGEVPSPLGMLGVFVVSISGYLLGLVTTSGKPEQPSSPSKAKLPVSAPPTRTSASGSTLQHLQQQQQQSQSQELPSSHHQHPYHQQQPHQRFHEEWRDHNHQRINHDFHSSRSSKGKSKGNQVSVWAMAYYKGKSPHVAPSGLSSSADHHRGDAAAAYQQWDGGSNSSAFINDFNSNGAANGHSHWEHSSSSSSSCDDSQAKTTKEHRVDSKTTGRAAVAAAAVGRAARLLHEQSTSRSLRQWVSSCLAELSGPRAAPAMVLTTAFLYSITASLDKLGIAAAQHSLTAYFLGQRLLMGIGGVFYLLCFARGALRHIVTDMVLLCSISLVEQLAVVFYLIAINNILVSYVVAIKRINVLLSTLIGCVMFKEHVGKRIPYIIVMLCGMLMIVLQPGHEDLHHSHHT